MAEEPEKKPAHERRYGKDEKKPESKKEPEGKSEGDDSKEGGEGEKPDARKMMMKRHEKEHRDLHGNHITAMRQMMDRHEQEKSAMDAQESGGEAPAAGMGEDQGE